MKKSLVLILATLSLSYSTDARSDCGTTGSIEDRIVDCNQQKTVGSFVWRMVSSQGYTQAWIDETTGTIWTNHSFGLSSPTSDGYREAIEACENSKAFDLGKMELPSIDDYKSANAHGLIRVMRGFGGRRDSGSPFWYWTIDQCSSPWPSGCLTGVYWDGLDLYSRRIWETGNLPFIKCALKRTPLEK